MQRILRIRGKSSEPYICIIYPRLISKVVSSSSEGLRFVSLQINTLSGMHSIIFSILNVDFLTENSDATNETINDFL